MMRKNANESLKTLNERDVIITPDLEGFGGLDANKYTQIIQKGEDKAKEDYKEKLANLSLSKQEYELYKKSHMKFKRINYVLIDNIVITNPTYIDNDIILHQIKLKEGQKLDEKELRKNILSLYNLGYFDSIDYEILKKDGKNTLHVSTTPSWNNRGEINFSLGLEDDFKGHSSYSLKGGGFFGSLSSEVYAGFSAELGNTWAYKDGISLSQMHTAGSLYMAVDTILGPLYFAYGHSDNSNSALYLYLGEKF